MLVAASDGDCIASFVGAMMSDTASTSIPIGTPSISVTIMTLRSSTSGVERPKRAAKSSSGNTTPRRLTTPRKNSGASGSEEGVVHPRISRVELILTA